MPTEFWYPTSTATHDLFYDDWTLAAGANKNAACRPGGGRQGPMTHDDATSYLSDAVNTHAQALNLDWPRPIGALPSGFTFTCYWRTRAIANTPTRTLRLTDSAGNTSASLIFTTTNATAAWTNEGPVDISNGTNFHPTAATWAPSHFEDELQVQARPYHSVVSTQVGLTSLWGQLQYTPPPAGWVFLLGLAGAILPNVGNITDLLTFRKFLDWKRKNTMRGTIVHANELREAWADIRAYKFPKQFDLGVYHGFAH